MPSKRFVSKPPETASPPVRNALLMAAAAGYGLWILVTKGRVSWPPNELLAGAYTLAGCLALVGPAVLFRREGAGGGGGLGELLWMTGGLLIWVFDVAAAARGELRTLSWATPLGVQGMGLTMLAVLLAGWRTRGGSRDWSWTNVTGWLLGLFWVGMAVTTFVPARALPAMVSR